MSSGWRYKPFFVIKIESKARDHATSRIYRLLFWNFWTINEFKIELTIRKISRYSDASARAFKIMIVQRFIDLSLTSDKAIIQPNEYVKLLYRYAAYNKTLQKLMRKVLTNFDSLRDFASRTRRAGFASMCARFSRRPSGAR